MFPKVVHQLASAAPSHRSRVTPGHEISSKVQVATPSRFIRHALSACRTSDTQPRVWLAGRQSWRSPRTRLEGPPRAAGLLQLDGMAAEPEPPALLCAAPP